MPSTIAGYINSDVSHRAKEQPFFSRHSVLPLPCHLRNAIGEVLDLASLVVVLLLLFMVKA